MFSTQFDMVLNWICISEYDTLKLPWRKLLFTSVHHWFRLVNSKSLVLNLSFDWFCIQNCLFPYMNHDDVNFVFAEAVNSFKTPPPNAVDAENKKKKNLDWRTLMAQRKQKKNSYGKGMFIVYNYFSIWIHLFFLFLSYRVFIF